MTDASLEAVRQYNETAHPDWRLAEGAGAAGNAAAVAPGADDGLTRMYLTGYQGIGPVPPPCPVCGEDIDIHEWIDVAGGGQMTACDRSEPGRPAPRRAMRAALIISLEPAGASEPASAARLRARISGGGDWVGRMERQIDDAVDGTGPWASPRPAQPAPGQPSDEDDPEVQAERDRCMPQACNRCGGEVPRDGAPPDHLDGCAGPLPPQPGREEMIAAGCLDGSWPATISVFSDAHAEHMRINGDCPWCGSYDQSKWLPAGRRKS